MACTKEEIERKRLAALQKRNNKLCNPSKSNFNQNSPGRWNPMESGSPSPSSSYVNKTQFNSRHHPYAKVARNSEERNASIVPVGKVVSGTMYLISEDRFEVNPSEFCTPLINIFKSMPSKSYGG